MKIGSQNKEKARAWKQAQRAGPQVSVQGSPSGEGEKSPMKRMAPRHLVMFALWGYSVLVAAYWIYCLAYERGLVGYLMYLEMSWTGSISPKLVALVAMVVLTLPALPLASWQFVHSDMPLSFTPPPDRPWRPL